MDDYTVIHTPKFHIPPRRIRTPSPPRASYCISLLQNEDEFFGCGDRTRQADTGDQASTRDNAGKETSSGREAETGEKNEAAEGAEEAPTAEKGDFALVPEGEARKLESFCGTAAERAPVKHCDSPPPVTSPDPPGALAYGLWSEESDYFSRPVCAAARDHTPKDAYKLFCEDEKALEAALPEAPAGNISYHLSAPSSAALHIRTSQMFSCVSTQAAAPPASQKQHESQSPQLPQQQGTSDEGKAPPHTPRCRPKKHLSPKGKGGQARSHRRSSSGGRRGRHRGQQALRSYSMLDIENDAFTAVHENDVESEAGQCLRIMKTICGFLLMCLGLFLLLTCPKMKQTSSLTFYYILFSMLAELFIALCFGCSICLLACLVGEQGAVYANATCGLLHRVAEGIAHYTLTGFGGYLLYNFRELEGVWYASGEEEREKFLYLLVYVGCEATMSLLYSLQTLGTLFGICRFIGIKVYSKLSGRGDVYFLHGDAPIIYASLDQYRHALRHMRNPVEVAFERRVRQQEHRQAGDAIV